MTAPRSLAKGEKSEESGLKDHARVPTAAALLQWVYVGRVSVATAIERAYIMWVLQAESGNKTRTAEVLGIDPSTLYRKLARYDSDFA